MKFIKIQPNTEFTNAEDYIGRNESNKINACLLNNAQKNATVSPQKSRQHLCKDRINFIRG